MGTTMEQFNKNMYFCVESRHDDHYIGYGSNSNLVYRAISTGDILSLPWYGSEPEAVSFFSYVHSGNLKSRSLDEYDRYAACSTDDTEGDI